MSDMLRLDRFIQTGELPAAGNMQRAAVDLTDLYPLFLSNVVRKEDGEYAVEATFLKYLYTPGQYFSVEVKKQEKPIECTWYPGRLLGGGAPGNPTGPFGIRSADVMIVTSRQYPLYIKENAAKSVVDTTPITTGVIDHFRKVLIDIGFKAPDISKWYMTSLVKFSNPSLDDTLPSSWIKGCYPWLLQEIYLLKPKYIICAGVHSLKKFFGNSATLKKYTGQLVDLTLNFTDGSSHTCKVLSLPAFGSVVDLDVDPVWYRQLTLLYNDMNSITVEAEYPRRHVAVHTANALWNEINRIKQLARLDPKRRIIAVDLEWEGEYPEQKGAKVLTVQFSSYPGEATVVLLNDMEKELFREGVPVAAQLLETLFTEQPGWKPRLGGHFLRADLPWILSLGISELGLKKAYQPANTPEECRDEGGWDTGLMYHAYREAEEIGDGYGLKILALKECNVPRYDLDLLREYEKFSHSVEIKDDLRSEIAELQDRLSVLKQENKQDKEKHKEEIADLEEDIKELRERKNAIPNTIKPKGFGCIPMDVLKPYAAWDADATRRLAELCIYGMSKRPALLDDDHYGNSCWEAFWRSHRASWGFGEMERTGFVLDLGRLTRLSSMFSDCYDRMLDQFRDEMCWEDFNPNSTEQRRGLLFGRAHAKKKDGTYVMPEEAKSFNLEPIRATDKTEWESIDDEDKENYSASTDSLSVSIFAQRHPEVRKFKDLCKLGRVLAGNIRPPQVTLRNGKETVTWDKGIYTYLREDGRVHTHLSQTKKTGRASSFDPPMQNIGKSAEATLQTTLGYVDSDGEVIANYLDLFGEPRYLYPCRTILRAAPGNVLIESDFTGAELAVMAWASGDPSMIEHVKRNALPESDPNYYDIHSHIAVKAFHLDCEPTKAGLVAIHKKHLRVAAKSVVFGIPYGRGLKAILLQCQAEGVYLDEEEGAALLDSYFTLYPMTKVFLEQCKKDVENKRFVKTLFNRYRRFSWNMRQDELAKAKREACNAPIQGTVADSINNAIFNLMEYKESHPELPFTLNMQIHDALVLETSARNVKSLKKVIHQCMVENNPVVVKGVPHYYGLDSECYVHWGEELSEEICQREFGLSLEQVV